MDITQINYNFASQLKKFKENGVFYTPKELAEVMKGYIDVGEYEEVYDPTIGHGALLEVFPKEVKKFGQELDSPGVEFINQLRGEEWHAEQGDLLLEDKFKDKKFKVIMANPPYSLKYEQTPEIKEDERFRDLPALPPRAYSDFLFIQHCIYKMTDDGIAAILMSPGVCYRKNAELKIRTYLTDKNYLDKVIQIPGKKFEDTDIATVVLVFKKNKTNTDVLFIDTEQEPQVEKIVSYEEIVENNYNWSVSTYIPKPDKKEKINIIELEQQLYFSRLEWNKKTFNIMHMADKLKFAKKYRLEEICGITTGERVNIGQLKEGEIPAIGGGMTPTGLNHFANFNGGIVITKEGCAGTVTWYDEVVFLTDSAVSIKPKSNVALNEKYLYHTLKALEPKLIDIRNNIGIPRLNMEQIRNIEISVPSLAKQEEILKHLESATPKVATDFRNTLAGIYEYYRNELFSNLLKGGWGNEI